MATEPWNRLHIPRPAIQSLIKVPLKADTVNYIKDVVKECGIVKSSLTNDVLDAEKATLRSMLYVYHHRLCYHKPYLALKQVEQCLKRLTAMDLKGSVQEMLDLCPKYIGQTETHCSLPSQPIIELLSVKILGACKLILRLMDCCCKAFHLCLQHLNLEEFMVMNVVLLGLLSRLWVLHRGVLIKLISLYGAQLSLQHEVSCFQNMPYIKGFDFSTKIEDHLGHELLDTLKRELPHISSRKESPQLLNKIFLTKKLKDKAKAKMVKLPERRKNIVDLGKPIHMDRKKKGEFGTFDVRTLCHPVKSSIHPDQSYHHKLNLPKKTKSLPHHRSKNKCAMFLLPKVQQADCFRDLHKQLQCAIRWCKQRKLELEVGFLREKNLKIYRLRYVEALGYSLEKKLQHMKKSISHSLLQGRLKANYHMPARLWTWKNLTLSSRKKRARSRKFDIDSKVSRTARTHFKNLNTPVLAPCNSSNILSLTCIRDTDTGKVFADRDDIDNIFSSIGV